MNILNCINFYSNAFDIFDLSKRGKSSYSSEACTAQMYLLSLGIIVLHFRDIIHNHLNGQ